MNEIDAMKLVSEALEKLQTAEERGRVLMWAHSKFGGASPRPAGGLHVPVAGVAPLKTKSQKKSKSIIAMDKSLNLSPTGKQSALEFASDKAPSNAQEKCVVAVHYLRDVIELQSISVQAVLTFFKTVQWPPPTDLKNKLQQAGSKGWLDTANSEDIKLTTLGERLVEHDLSAKAKKKG